MRAAPAARSYFYNEVSLSEGTAPNSRNAEEELQRARHELDFLQNNLAEKLFEKIQASSEKTI